MYDYFYHYPVWRQPENLFNLSDYRDGSPFDYFTIITEDGDTVITEDGLQMVTEG